jgi:hypothetical protein
MPRKFETQIIDAISNLNLGIKGKITVILREDAKNKTTIIAHGEVAPKAVVAPVKACVLKRPKPKPPAKRKSLRKNMGLRKRPKEYIAPLKD